MIDIEEAGKYPQLILADLVLHAGVCRATSVQAWMLIEAEHEQAQRDQEHRL